MTTWEYASSKLGNVSDAARSIAKEVFTAAQAAGHDVWFLWGDGQEEEHRQNHVSQSPVIDFMVHTKEAGDWVRNYVWGNRARIRLKHVIWRQHITSTVTSPGVVRLMDDRGDDTANHKDHVHMYCFSGAYQPPTSNTVPVSNPMGHLDVDGELGPKTIAKWQKIMGTAVDGFITAGNSDLVRAVQRKLRDLVDHRLVVDGDGIYQNGRPYNTIGALQRYLKSPVDQRLSVPKSECVKALQRRLNEGWF
jgi:hypothetical protein